MSNHTLSNHSPAHHSAHQPHLPPLPVVISLIIHENKILLIKRVRGSYVGLWSMPGGKIEPKEHINEAIMRETLEEAGIETTFVRLQGIVSEHLLEQDKLVNHFLIYLCQLQAKTTEVKEGKEGMLQWFDLATVEEFKDAIIPSDYLIIQKIIKNNDGFYYNSVIHKDYENYSQKKFEKVC